MEVARVSTREAIVANVTSPVGVLGVSATELGVSRIWFFNEAQTTRTASATAQAFAAAACAQLAEYFAGTRAVFDVPLDLFQGTEFQQRVWRELLNIPCGETRSYSELASTLGDAKLVRAVGTANGANPIGVIVPCHRVIGANGTLIGYAGGLERKRWLLRHEAKSWPREGSLF